MNTRQDTYDRIVYHMPFSNMAISLACKEPGHFGNHIVVIVVVIEVNSLLFFRTHIDKAILQLFRDDVELILD